MATSASRVQKGLSKDQLSEVPETSSSQIQSDANKLVRKEKKIWERTRPGQVLAMEGPNGAADASAAGHSQNQGDNRKFPVQLVPVDDRDEKYAVKTELLSKIPGARVEIDDGDVEYARDKLRAEQQAQFMHYLLNRYNWNDGHTYEKMSKLFPEIIEAQKAEIDKKAEIQKRLAYIALQNGQPMTKDEFLLMHMLEAGMIEIPKGPLWNPQLDADQTYEDGLNRGLLNPMRYFSYTKHRASSNRMANTNILGRYGSLIPNNPPVKTGYTFQPGATGSLENLLKPPRLI